MLRWLVQQMGIQDLLTVLCVQEEFSYSYPNIQKDTRNALFTPTCHNMDLISKNGSTWSWWSLWFNIKHTKSEYGREQNPSSENFSLQPLLQLDVNHHLHPKIKFQHECDLNIDPIES